MAKDLKDIEVGDRVWVSSGYSGKRSRIQAVARLTPTQIILEGYYTSSKGVSDYNRYERGRKSRYSSTLHYGQIHSGTSRSSILSIATLDECKQWDAEQAVKAEENAQAEQKRQALEAKRLELDALFADNIHVTKDSHVDGWQVLFWNLSEDKVRILAELLKQAA